MESFVSVTKLGLAIHSLGTSGGQPAGQACHKISPAPSWSAAPIPFPCPVLPAWWSAALFSAPCLVRCSAPCSFCCCIPWSTMSYVLWVGHPCCTHTRIHCIDIILRCWVSWASRVQTVMWLSLQVPVLTPQPEWPGTHQQLSSLGTVLSTHPDWHFTFMPPGPVTGLSSLLLLRAGAEVSNVGSVVRPWRPLVMP